MPHICYPPAHRDAPLAQVLAFPADVTWVRAQMVATIDGAATGADGRSGSLGTATDHTLFMATRAAADVIVVGAATARIEGYGPVQLSDQTQTERRAAGLTAVPQLAVLTQSGDVPTTLRKDPGTLFVVSDATAKILIDQAVPEERLIQCGTEVTPPVARKTLAAQGFRRILCEGGPSALADWIAAHVVDDLFVTTSPQCVGQSPGRITDGVDLQQAARLGHIIVGQDTVHTRWVLHRD